MRDILPALANQLALALERAQLHERIRRAELLEEADRIVARWVAEHLGTALPDPPRITTGEVIVQRGL